MTELKSLSLREIKSLRDKRYNRYKKENDQNDAERSKQEAVARNMRAEQNSELIRQRILDKSYNPPS